MAISLEHAYLLSIVLAALLYGAYDVSDAISSFIL